MVNPNNGWLHGLIQVGGAAIVAVVFAMGCATPIAPEGAGAGTSDAMVQTIGDVSVSRDGTDSVVWLDGLIDPIYAVSTPEDSNLIVVDLVGVGKSAADPNMDAVDDEGQQIAAYDGVVDLVTLATFDEGADTPLTRVEIVMAVAGRAEILSTGDGLEIRIIPDNGISVAMADGSDADDSQVSLADDADGEPALWGSEDESTELASTNALDPGASMSMSMAPPPEATQLTSLSAETTDGGVLVSLHADGGIASLETFTLTDPARLVVDLPGLTVGDGVSSITLDSEFVSGVRLGAHDGKIRIVLDGGPNVDDFQGRQIMPGTTGLWIAIGGGDALASAMNEAMSASEAAWIASSEATTVTEEAPIAELALAPIEEDETDAEVLSPVVIEESEATIEDATIASLQLAEIYGLHYERADGMDRTAILADEAVPYTISKPDSTTLVVSLPGAMISEQASDRIFPEAGGPVSLIHVFQQPDVEVSEVRVVFTRAPGLEPVVSRRGSMLFVDFEDMGVAAAPPPAFPDAGSVDEEAAPMIVAVGAVPSEDGVDSAIGMDSNPVAAVVVPTEDMASAMVTEEPAMMAMADTEEVLPSFGGELEDVAGPAALADTTSVWDAPADALSVPAAVEVPAAIEVLEEGGLIDGKEYRGRRVSLDFKDVEIADVLRLIAEVSDLNIIAGDEVSGNVTIRLVEVPWDQALDVILMTKGLGFVRVGNVLRIAPSEVLKAEEEIRLQERRNKEKLEDLEVKLMPVNYASVADVEGLVKRLLSARGTVNLDQRTNTLIIKDISSVIDEATALIAAIDTQTPQVMIEAKIVEAALGFSRELGTVWGIQTNQFVDAFDPSTPQRGLGSQDFRPIDDNSLVFANPITSIPTGLATIGALILDEDFRIDAQIQAAESTGDGKVVSSPRIVTLDNKQAKIEQGVSIPFQTFEGGDAKLEFIDAVLSLIVTPHITSDESIIMEVEVTRNSPDDSISTPTGSPAIAKNQAETEALVKDGQTLVLGGIYTLTKSRRQSRVPYLHRIPVIGNMFKSNEITDARKELLIFVTPRIVRLPEMASN
jgi:type IV pilus secretin PilQ/predicted competence protein